MGAIFAKPPVHHSLTSEYAEFLESLNEQIEKTEQERNTTSRRHKKIVRSLILYGFGIYGIIAAAAYVIQADHTLASRFWKIAPLFLFPLAVYGIKQIIDWWFTTKVESLEKHLEALDKEKQDKLEELVKKSDFLETQKLLMKHKSMTKGERAALNGPPGTVPATPSGKGTAPGPGATPAPATPAPAQKHGAFQTPARPTGPVQVPATAPPQQKSSKIAQTPSTTGPNPQPLNSGNMAPPPPPAPQQTSPSINPNAAPDTNLRRLDVITPSQRGAFDKVIDFVLGDGPNNRYALICGQCATHNGLAREEDLNIRYRCPFCGFLNGYQPPAAVARNAMKMQQAQQEAQVQAQQAQQQAQRTQQPTQQQQTQQQQAQQQAQQQPQAGPVRPGNASATETTSANTSTTAPASSSSSSTPRSRSASTSTTTPSTSSTSSDATTPKSNDSSASVSTRPSSSPHASPVVTPADTPKSASPENKDSDPTYAS